MTTLDLAFVGAHTTACAITCWYALCGLNAATRQTRWAVKICFALIAIGAFAALINPPDPDVGGSGQLLVMAGLAVGFLGNRRRCGCVNCPAPRRKDTVSHA